MEWLDLSNPRFQNQGLGHPAEDSIREIKTEGETAGEAKVNPSAIHASKMEEDDELEAV